MRVPNKKKPEIKSGKSDKSWKSGKSGGAADAHHAPLTKKAQRLAASAKSSAAKTSTAKSRNAHASKASSAAAKIAKLGNCSKSKTPEVEAKALRKAGKRLAGVRRRQPRVAGDQAARAAETVAKSKSDQLVTRADKYRGMGHFDLPDPEYECSERVEEKSGPGRPREGWIEFPQFDTMAQAAAATGVPMPALKVAKSAGCPAFKHGRVDFGEFLRWWFNANFDTTDWSNELQKAKALREQIRLGEDKGRVIDFRKVERFLDEVIGRFFFAEIERMTQEFPPALKGLDETQISTVIAGDMERVKHELASKLATFVPKAEKGEPGVA
jgi:hypothetical protein